VCLPAPRAGRFASARQVAVPPLGHRGVVASCGAPSHEQEDFEFLRSRYPDGLVPWADRPDLKTVADVLGFLRRRGLAGSEALALKRRMIADVVQ